MSLPRLPHLYCLAAVRWAARPEIRPRRACRRWRAGIIRRHSSCLWRLCKMASRKCWHTGDSDCPAWDWRSTRTRRPPLLLHFRQQMIKCRRTGWICGCIWLRRSTALRNMKKRWIRVRLCWKMPPMEMRMPIICAEPVNCTRAIQMTQKKILTAQWHSIRWTTICI